MNIFNIAKLSLLILCVASPLSAKERINVYAASSMTNALDALVEAYETTSDISVTKVFAGTSSLARQIEQGAPADVFISANQSWMNYLVDGERVNRDAVTQLATNRLVVVSHSKADLDLDSVESWQSALGGERFSMGLPSSVPVGIYAKQALESYGIWDSIKHSSAPTNNVRSALTLAERNEVALAIVYLTDAKMSDDVEIVATFPSSRHDKITYPMAILNDKPSTQSFADFLLSDEGKAILHRFGFE